MANSGRSPKIFRAWDTEEVEMVSDGLLFYWRLLDCDELPNHHVELGFDNDHFKRFVIMQYIGEQDKYGNRIFEDDIVLYEDTRYQVKWLGCEFLLEPLNILQLTEMGLGYHIKPTLIRDYLEIIGNIHENEELSA